MTLELKSIVGFQGTDERGAKYMLEMSSIGISSNSIAAFGYPNAKVGDLIELGFAEPRKKDGLVAATREDYEKYGEKTADGLFEVVSV